ncbi:PA0069 family radical SAM protein [Mesonia ostreae]|uniref:PA0069 family radical SAM protein n=1 Tax=Mesonia ostreae TaxID=861110 RepID=A0ABU2KIC0_9FLAO|nr:PA0069 family radical SAM protein [Mesonia ostreae]MDT0294424.1 PA0069 family radical SAM protein [Mesonia ostreae]
MSISYQKGRGAQKNVHNKFQEYEHSVDSEYLEYCHKEGEEPQKQHTNFLEVFPKTFVNKVKSPDVGMGFSANPYQGCEHGCIYCYARNTHEYWGYGAGLDFEKQILVKKNAPELLEQKLKSKNWQGDAIVFSGNTDCYQPIERKLQITRQCLEVMLQYKHPTGIITKNSLILRDLDLLKELAQLNLIRVNISITSLSEETRRLLEPRTASIKQRLKTVEELSMNGIPVSVMMAPIIPSINSHEILPLVKKVSELGARSVGYTVVRLNGAIAEIFKDWIEKALPDRAEKVLHQIEACHGGNLNDSRFGTRMKGEGEFAKQIALQFKIARGKYFSSVKEIPALDKSHYLELKNPQYTLF